MNKECRESWLWRWIAVVIKLYIYVYIYICICIYIDIYKYKYMWERKCQGSVPRACDWALSNRISISTSSSKSSFSSASVTADESFALATASRNWSFSNCNEVKKGKKKVNSVQKCDCGEFKRINKQENEKEKKEEGASGVRGEAGKEIDSPIGRERKPVFFF